MNPTTSSNSQLKNDDKATFAMIAGIVFIVYPIAGILFSILGLVLSRSKFLRIACSVLVLANIWVLLPARLFPFKAKVSAIVTNIISPNSAQKNIRPIVQSIETTLGGKEICSEGSSGHGIDNTQPWFTAAYVIKKANAQATVIESSRGLSSPLSKSKMIYDYYGNPNNYKNDMWGKKTYIEPLRSVSMVNETTFNSKSTYLTNFEVTQDPVYDLSAPRVEVRIDYTSTASGCMSGNKFVTASLKNDEALITIFSRAPDTH